MSDAQRIYDLDRSGETPGGSIHHAGGIEVHAQREVLRCARRLDRVSGNRDIANWTIGIDHAVLRRPALHHLPGVRYQLALAIELEVTRSRVQGVSGWILHHKEAIAVDGGVVAAAGLLNGTLRIKSFGLRRGNAAADLRRPAIDRLLQ